MDKVKRIEEEKEPSVPDTLWIFNKKKENIPEGEIHFGDLESTGARTPKIYYTTKYEGQANYIMTRLKEERVNTLFFNKQVRIFSSKKVDKFLEIVKESLVYANKTSPILYKNSATYSMGQALICVMLRRQNKFADLDFEIECVSAYVTEDNMSKLKYHIYKKEIPVPKCFYIFRTKKDMIEHLMNKEKFIV